MKTVLVTGAAGALGRAVAAHAAASYRVLAASRQPVAGGVQLDVQDREQFAALLKLHQPDLILHLAATFVNDFDTAYATNVDATRQLLDTVQLLDQQTGRKTRVVLVGSAAEYGVVKPEENPVREDRAVAPVSVYGLSKAWQTQLAGVYAARGVDVVVGRVFNLDGPGLSERLFAGRLQAQIDAVLAGRQDSIELGPLGATRDYLHTAKAAEQLLAIAEHGAAGAVYHVASGIPVVMRDLMRQRLAEHGLDTAIVKEAPELTNRSGYDVPVIYADMTRTNELMQRRGKDGQA